MMRFRFAAVSCLLALLGAIQVACSVWSDGSGPVPQTGDGDAGGSGDGSSPVQGAPDLVAPTILKRQPTDGDAQVAIGSAIEVTFSKAVRLGGRMPTLLGPNNTSIGLKAEFGADRRTLKLVPTTPLVAPVKVSIELGDVTDEANNRLAPSSWSWTHPLWLTTRDAVTAPSTSYDLPSVAVASTKVILAATETTLDPNGSSPANLVVDGSARRRCRIHESSSRKTVGNSTSRK